MIRNLFAMLLAGLSIATALPPSATAQEAGPADLAALPAPRDSGHVEAGGVSYYYAVYGEGEPLLLLHGGLGLIEMFGPNLAALAAERQVIGVDLHGHGRTPLGGGLRDAGWQREHMSKNRLAILPDLTHYEAFAHPALVRTALPFLDGKTGARSWAEQVDEAP